jgi:tetratricopeptide (TPR) repeat protein
LLADGERALQDADFATARNRFETALAIDPANGAARQKLQKTATQETVQALIASGERHEKNRRWGFALADFQQALKIDPGAEQAQKNLLRVKKLLRDEAFQNLMSDGMTAFYSKDYPLARQKLKEAQSIKPDSSEAREALLQVDEAIQLQHITRLLQDARSAEETENWREALISYAAVLNIDPAIQAAMVGKQRATQKIRTTERINFFLDHPEELHSDEQLARAATLLETVRQSNSTGPRLELKLQQLERLVTAARTPVRLIIASDNQTEVAVYRVGKLGRFGMRELNLRPGTYTIVGSRQGYKDVRREITLSADKKVQRITIECEETI